MSIKIPTTLVEELIRLNIILRKDAKMYEDFAIKEDKELGQILVEKDIVLICGRYEGIDERFIENYVDQIYSIGDYVLTGGELAVMTLLDSSVRFVPGILGNK